ncbi:glycosyltransferase family 4 protein [Wenzhouxiangella sp. EGI_FJ10305]|uniref:glycosyltransferase family 4 protein n=1 Tax=Wenzhouxiangella sp. EGI_FJ10305 TaxID=3243768 RepID=UPI0035E2225C
MRLLINTSLLRFGGAVQVALSFIYECRRHNRHEYHVVVGPGVGAVLDPAEFPENFRFHHKSFGVMKLPKLPRVQREMAAIERRARPDCVVTSSGPPFWRSHAPHLVGFNRPLFIYPESPYLQNLPHTRKARLAAERWLHCRYFRRDADALIVQTDDVNQRVRRLLRTDQVFTVTNNHNGWYSQPEEHPARLTERKDDTFRFLTLTSYYPHKNLELIPRVIQALPAALRKRTEFVLTLTEAQYRERIGTEIPAQVRLIGPVPPPECPSLYQECDAMFLPTLAECFSASYPEAMKMEKPIVTTDLGFARSICQDAALYFQPCDANSAARQITRLIEDPALQGELRERGRHRLSDFDTPVQRAEKILSICEDLVVERSGKAYVKSLGV